MRSRFLLKLNSKAGESLIESLVAILIFTMASIIMYSMVIASADINRIAKENDAKIYQELLVAEKAEGSPFDTETVTMTITTASGTTSVAGGTVSIYGEPGSTLYAYYDKGDS